MMPHHVKGFHTPGSVQNVKDAGQHQQGSYLNHLKPWLPGDLGDTCTVQHPGLLFNYHIAMPTPIRGQRQALYPWGVSAVRPVCILPPADLEREL